MTRSHHVWVSHPHRPTLDPGLVLSWRQGDEWEALVTYVDSTIAGRVVTEWIAAERLTPVPWRPYMGTAYG